MSFSKINSNTYLPLIIFLIFAIRSIIMFLMPLENAITFYADDTFYYQKLACNFSSGNGWTFNLDNPTTGFHLLHAYILAFLNLLISCDNWRITYLLLGIFNAFLIGLTLRITIQIIKFNLGERSKIVPALFFFSVPLIMQSTMGMETIYVLYLSSIFYYFVFVKNVDLNFIKFSLNIGKNKSFSIIPFLVLGILGSLARTDFLLSQIGVFISFIPFYFLNKKDFFTKNFSKLKILISTTLGSIIGIIIVFIHNFISAGTFLQNSAKVKLYWSSISGFSPIPVLGLFRSIFPFPYSGWEIGKLFLLITSIIILIKYLKEFQKKTGFKLRIIFSDLNDKASITFSTFLILIFYLCFYSLNSSALQMWYMSNILIPLALFAGCITEDLVNYKFRNFSFHFIFKFLLFLNIGISIFSSINPDPFLSKGMKNLHQTGMYKAALFLKKADLDGKIGSWNAGALSFFSKKDIINLDGLVNNEILPYLKKNNLIEYLKKENIKYIADYGVFFKESSQTDEEINNFLIKKGLYGSEYCYSKFKQNIDQNSEKWFGSNISIYKMNDKCIK